MHFPWGLVRPGSQRTQGSSLRSQTASLSTLTPSPIIKVSNLHDREDFLDVNKYNELLEDMEE